MKTKTQKKKAGISLIVLVITIIVMIILASAIILSLNSSGIIGKANEAKTATDIANAKEVVAIAKADWMLEEEKIKDQDSTIQTFSDYAEKKLGEAGYNITEGTDGSYEVLNDGTIYSYPKIPEGFVASTYTGEKKYQKD